MKRAFIQVGFPRGVKSLKCSDMNGTGFIPFLIDIFSSIVRVNWHLVVPKL